MLRLSSLLSSKSAKLRLGALLLIGGGLSVVACSSSKDNSASSNSDFNLANQNDAYSKLPYWSNPNLK